MNPILLEVQAERDRQIAKGYTTDHDDEATEGQLAEVAGMVLLSQHTMNGVLLESRAAADYILNKWGDDRRRQIIIALAMGIAEIERLDRMEKRSK